MNREVDFAVDLEKLYFVEKVDSEFGTFHTKYGIQLHTRDGGATKYYDDKEKRDYKFETLINYWDGYLKGKISNVY